MKNRGIEKLEAITPSTLVVGIDIAKHTQWARFVDYRGLELGKVLKFHNNKNGFDSILTSIQTIYKSKRFNDVIIGMEPTGQPNLYEMGDNAKYYRHRSGGGDPVRFDNPRQISKMVGYNLVEDSSGNSKSGTAISKRGRKNLRNILYCR